MSQTRILLFDFDAADGCDSLLPGILHSSGCVAELREERAVVSAGMRSDAELLESLSGFNPDIIFFNLKRDALERAVALFPLVRMRAPGVPAVIVIEGCATEELLALLRLGFDEYIAPPLNHADIITRLGWLLDRSRRAEPLTQSLKEKLGLKQFVGESRALLEEIRKIPLVAKCDANVMILGETGTGKELCARAVHYLSPRAHGPFITVNCGAIPVELVENELFGHERGAYTGATCAGEGLVQGSDGGTLFLDEVDCLPPAAQVKLLRFLQEKEFRALGSTKTRKVNARIIAATNAVLEEAVREGRLRQDLYYRLNVIPLRLPPLRERREDIPVLARHFLAKYAEEFEREAREFSPEALRVLTLYDWPGNIRELQHTVERAVVLCERRVVGAEDVELPALAASAPTGSFKDLKASVVAQFEKSYLLNTLLACDWNITRAARLSCKNRRAFWQLLRKHGIDVRHLKFNP